MLTDLATTSIGTPTAWQPPVHNTGHHATGGIWRVTTARGTAILEHATPGH